MASHKTTVTGVSNLVREPNFFPVSHKQAIDRLYSQWRLLDIEVLGNPSVKIFNPDVGSVGLLDEAVQLDSELCSKVTEVLLDGGIAAINLGEIVRSDKKEIYFWTYSGTITTKTPLHITTMDMILQGSIKRAHKGLMFDTKENRSYGLNPLELFNTAHAFEDGNVYLLILHNKDLNILRDKVPEIRQTKTLKPNPKRQKKINPFKDDPICVNKVCLTLGKDTSEVQEYDWYGTSNQEMDYYKGGWEAQKALLFPNVFGEDITSPFLEHEIENQRRMIITLLDAEAIYSDDFISRVSDLLSGGYQVEIDCGTWEGKSSPADNRGVIYEATKNNRLGFQTGELDRTSFIVSELLPNGVSPGSPSSGVLMKKLQRHDDLDISSYIFVSGMALTPGIHFREPHLFVILRKIEKPRLDKIEEYRVDDEFDRYYDECDVRPIEDSKQKKQAKVEFLVSKLEKDFPKALKNILKTVRRGKSVNLVADSSGTKELLGFEIRVGNSTLEVELVLTPGALSSCSEIYVPLILELYKKDMTVAVIRKDYSGQEEPNDLLVVSKHKKHDWAGIYLDDITDTDYDGLTFPVISSFASKKIPVVMRFGEKEVPGLDDVRFRSLVDHIYSETGVEVELKKLKTKNPDRPIILISPYRQIYFTQP